MISCRRKRAEVDQDLGQINKAWNEVLCGDKR